MCREPGSLSSRVFVYGVLSTLAVSLVLALLFGVALTLSVREVADLRASLADARASENTCRIVVERLDAKLEQFEEWLQISTAHRSGRAAVGGK